MKILAIDPGISTGVAAFFDAPTLVPTYETFTTKDNHEVYDLFTESSKFDTVVIERFSAQQISSYGLRTTELVGAIEALCYVNKIQFLRHQPQFRRALLDYAKRYLNKLGQSYTRHEADALAHLFAHQHFTLCQLKTTRGTGLVYRDMVLLT